MPKKPYSWETEDIDIIGAHSLAKHRILRRYVETYIDVLMRNPAREQLRLTLVDGFAGGGKYYLEDGKTIHLGSPLIAMQAVATAEAQVKEQRKKPIRVDARFIFVEKNETVAKLLRDVLDEYADKEVLDSRVNLRVGAFENELGQIIDQIRAIGRQPRAIFILDQYGYSDVSFPAIQRIFSELPNAEIFLTLAVGWISAYLSKVADAKNRICESLQIARSLSAQDVEDELLRTDADDSSRKMREVQRILHDAFATQAGAKFFTPFFIVSPESNRPYWFLHLANSDRANDEVKKLHWQIQTHFAHYGMPGLQMLGYDPKRDSMRVGQLTFGFDHVAEEQSLTALREELPRRIRERYEMGISVRNLYASVTNETPATRDMLRSTIRELCRDGELIKVGKNGEKRLNTTHPHLDDIVMPARQIVLPLFPGNRGKPE